MTNRTLHPQTAELVAWYRATFLAQEPQRHALMLPPGRLKKYDDRPEPITDALIAAHLDGTRTLAAPAARDGLACLLPLDVDAGGLPAIRALLDEARRRGYFAFGEYTPRPSLQDQEQRGYVYLALDELASAERLQLLGHQLVEAVLQEGWTIETRAHGADTRLPLGRHTHTGQYAELWLAEGQLAGAQLDRWAALQLLRERWTPNLAARLPALPAPQPQTLAQQVQARHASIAAYNQEHDVEQLLVSYGAKRASRRLYLCPFHDDRHASLAVYTDRAGQTVARCWSQHSGCPLATHGRYDAFNVFCIGEGLTEAEAIKRLAQERQGGARDSPEGEQGPGSPPAPQTPQTPAQSASAHAQQATPQSTQANQHESCMSKGTRRLWQVLQQLAGASRWCWPPLTRLAELADLDERSVRRSLRWLEQQGYLSSRPRPGQTTIYHLAGPDSGQAKGGHLSPTCDLKHDSGSDSDHEIPCEGGREAVPTSSAASPAELNAGELQGPGGAIYYPGGAAYVPPEAESWYERMQQLYASQLPAHDVLVDQMQLDQAAPLVDQVAAEREQPLLEAPATPDLQEQPAAARKKRRRRKVYTIEELAARIAIAERYAKKLDKTEPGRAYAVRQQISRLNYELELLIEQEQTTPEEPPAPATPQRPQRQTPAIWQISAAIRQAEQAPAKHPPARPQHDSSTGSRPPSQAIWKGRDDRQWLELQAYQAAQLEAQGEHDRARFLRQMCATLEGERA